MSEWISVEERLPTKYQWVLVTDCMRIEKAKYINIGSELNWFLYTVFYDVNKEKRNIAKYLMNVKFWMPLPEIPIIKTPSNNRVIYYINQQEIKLDDFK